MSDIWNLLMILGLAALLGGLIGLEREWRGEWAGLRTHMTVALGVAIMVQAGMSLPGVTATDLSRVLQGIAAGIGFIGAGAILKLTDQREIRGLTTAGSIWLSAAVGAACSVGNFTLAWVGTAFTLVILILVRKLEKIAPIRGNEESADSTERKEMRKKEAQSNRD